MADYSDQEDLDRFKAWWKEYGNALIVGILLGTGLLVGNKYWTQYQEERALEASVIYDQMLDAYRAKNVVAAGEGVDKLVKDYASTPYADLAALVMAKTLFQSGKSDDARARLEWVMNNTDDDATRHIARLRLAGVHADLGHNEQAIAVLDVDDRTGFESSYYELEGDLMIKMGEKEKAREAYRKALEKAVPGSSFASMISIKLNDLGTEGS